MKIIVIAVLLSAALSHNLSGQPPTQLNNSARSAHVKVVQQETQQTRAADLSTKQVEPAAVKTEVEPKSEIVVAATKPVKVSTPAPRTLQGCEAYRHLVSRYEWDQDVAYAVMQAENRSCDPNETSPVNRNGSVDRGLFQVNSVHRDMVDGDLSQLYDPAKNVEIAYRIYRGSGWKAWNTYKSGKYEQFL